MISLFKNKYKLIIIVVLLILLLLLSSLSLFFLKDKIPTLNKSNIIPNASNTVTPTSSTLIFLDRTSLINKFSLQSDCPDNNIDQVEKNDLVINYKITDNKYVLQVLCYIASYQNANFLVQYSSDTNSYNLLTLKVISIDNGNTTSDDKKIIEGDISFISSNNSFVIIDKFRAQGDCGSQQNYLFNADHLDLLEQKEHDDCSNGEADPTTWEQIYP